MEFILRNILNPVTDKGQRDVAHYYAGNGCYETRRNHFSVIQINTQSHCITTIIASTFYTIRINRNPYYIES